MKDWNVKSIFTKITTGNKLKSHGKVKKMDYYKEQSDCINHQTNKTKSSAECRILRELVCKYKKCTFYVPTEETRNDGNDQEI